MLELDNIVEENSHRLDEDPTNSYNIREHSCIYALFPPFPKQSKPLCLQYPQFGAMRENRESSAIPAIELEP